MQPIRIGLLGCGTVGGGVIQLLHANAEYLAESVGAKLEVARVLVRAPDKERVPELDRALLTTDAEAVFGAGDIDVFVEVMGGVAPAREYVERGLDAKRSVVTANKMLLAMHGPSLVDRAVANGVDLAFEGSVGGGIPVIRVLRDALASDWVTRLEGIVNGTCNYVLTRMRSDGRGFDEALKEAQAKGYAEADPTLDVDGHDAAHKLVVLAMLAFGARIDAARVPTEGIRGIDPIDHRFAERFGFIIKHLAIGRDRGEGVELRVHPALVRRDTPLANVNGVLNAIALEGRALGPCLLSGRGAGDMPTAVSVVADVLDVARAWRSGFAGTGDAGHPAAGASPQAGGRRADARATTCVSRCTTARASSQAPGGGARRGRACPIEQMVQEGGAGSSGVAVDIVMLTHEAGGAGRPACPRQHRPERGRRRPTPAHPYSVSRPPGSRSESAAARAALQSTHDPAHGLCPRAARRPHGRGVAPRQRGPPTARPTADNPHNPNTPTQGIGPAAGVGAAPRDVRRWPGEHGPPRTVAPDRPYRSTCCSTSRTESPRKRAATSAKVRGTSVTRSSTEPSLPGRREAPRLEERASRRPPSPARYPPPPPRPRRRFAPAPRPR